ncbi:hypothetical protein BT67DRAFT_459800 [Trichocladium antarcticum]|uniref:Uncharacterized protein n=1 Tax=Trichocladium antarcticum TaxID=1450529 RepID=A0AAN6UTQ4_9PEZI|nr:hypothetical protein BT67DRAFT_459800 [Trichocladium antarcticum]
MVMYAYLLVYPQRRVPAHWAILVTPVEDGTAGQVYHAVGSPFTGYQVEVKPSYDLSETSRTHSIVFLGYIDESWQDQLAEIAQGIKAPGVSPRPLDPFAGQNCQNWLEDFLQHLISVGAIDSSALSQLSTASRT